MAATIPTNGMGLDAGLDITGGNLTFKTADKGVNLGVTSGAASNLLHDYEEGTWTISIGNHDASEAMTLNGTYGGTSGTFYYNKIGSHVTVIGYVVATGNGTVDSGSEGLYINGLPFTVKNSTTTYSAVSIAYAQGLNITASEHISGYTRLNETHAALQRWDATSGSTALTRDEFSSDGGFIFTINYLTDA
tara:strand:- start:105 stop:677 length:573 start_codon:yes stop_codon:yes gene_type:complete